MGRVISSGALMRSLMAAAVLSASALMGGVAWAQAGAAVKVFSPQPADNAIKPGLTVRYYSLKIRYIDEMLRFIKVRPGTPGPVISAINFPDKGPGANVMGTDQAELVGAVIDGLIKFDQPGVYQVAMVVNDGVQLKVGDNVILEKDWTGAPSEMTDEVSVTVAQAGWHQLHVMYFQRKGTAALEMYWKKPGQAGGLELVPAEAFAHISE